jgi:phosphoglycerate dehydrogenase-like enzyme
MRLESADRLLALLTESDCVAVCCQWTPETTKLIGPEAFAAMKSGTILVNVARGEIIDEDALVVALEQGKLRGVGLDVYVGEFEREPDRRLWDRGADLFCDNLRAYLNGESLINVIDWSVGY